MTCVIDKTNKYLFNDNPAWSQLTHHIAFSIQWKLTMSFQENRDVFLCFATAFNGIFIELEYSNNTETME